MQKPSPEAIPVARHVDRPDAMIARRVESLVATLLTRGRMSRKGNAYHSAYPSKACYA